MADPSGFLKAPRENPKRRPVPLRVKDWQEVYEPFPVESLRPQAARCMDCGIPFCHNGCPFGNLIPEWNDLARRDDWAEASERLHATNNFPEFTGRLCPAPCETACVLGIADDPVTIKQIEVSIVDRAWDEGSVRPVPPAEKTGMRVAVIGSGPAGLAAAQQLTRAGHDVVVYERNDRPGGLLRYGIPEFKMEKAVLDRRLEQMRLEAPASSRAATSASTSPSSNCGRHTTRSCWRGAPPCRATCRCPAATSRGSTSRWTISSRPTGCRKAIWRSRRSPPRASTSSSSAAGTPAPTAWALRTARVPSR